MSFSPMLSARFVILGFLALALAAPGGFALAQESAPLRPGLIPPTEKDDNPVAPSAPPARTPAATLERLFERLAAAKSPEEAKGIANLIQRRWARSGSDTADLLMTRAQTAMRDKQMELAIELLDRVVTLKPDWAEGWNQRANALFVAGDPIRSMLDIGEALKREPRHFGAMMGLGMILRQQGDDKRAMVAYRRALEIYPQLEAIKSAVDSLKSDVEGRDA